MLIKQVIDVYDLIDRSDIDGAKVSSYFESLGAKYIDVTKFSGEKGSTDFIKIIIPGKKGKHGGGSAPTLGILGRLGGIGARPEMIGFVSDGDGALSALAVAAKLLDMQAKGDFLDGDVIICTHICPDAPTQPHDPVPFMGSPVDMATVNEAEVSGDLDAILSIDTTKGNRIINVSGFAISPTVKEGYILRISNDLLTIMQDVTGGLPNVFALTTQDITPYGNDLYHLNSILQPATATDAPVVGVAITTQTAVPGCATGASHFVHIEAASRFAVEVAKYFGQNKCRFYDAAEFALIQEKYGSMKHLQGFGKGGL
ncbi:MAG: DUF1177 domain-containing protein [Defluviitaleaceae bacterium]|nr:DUF1177 domain-containing protein [Defluviitaleaceae bacterium]